MAKKNDTDSPVGSHGGKDYLRQWASPSYDPTDGRSVSSVDEQGSREHVTNNNHARDHRQVPDGGFNAIDRKRTQSPVPVHKRPFSQSR